MKNFSRIFPAILGVAFSLYSSAADAQSPAIAFATNSTDIETNAKALGVQSYVLGFEFVTNTSTFVTSLGYFYDSSFNQAQSGSTDYSDSHDVGIYQINPHTGDDLLIVSTTITSASQQTGSFLYNSIAPIDLAANYHYIIAAVSGPIDPFVYDVHDPTNTKFNGIVQSPYIGYTQNIYSVGSSLQAPGTFNPYGDAGYFGPNFKVEVAPEMSSFCSLFLLSLVSAGGLVIYSRKSIKKFC